MATRNTQKWDQKTHEDILIEIFTNMTIPTAEIQKIIAKLREKGYTFSESALRQHIQKLRKNRDITGINNAAGGNSTDTGTPAKATPKKTATPRKRATPKKAKGKAVAASDDEEANNDFENLVKKEVDQDLSEKRPAKRVKQEAT
ncbi:hypothetical protein ACO1O0_004311 [Amphichorda felina]